MNEPDPLNLFWDDLSEDMKDPEYARHHARSWHEVRADMVAAGLVDERAARRSMRRLKWRAFWWGFTHPFGGPND